MSSQIERSPTQPAYIKWMLLFVAGFSVLQIAVGLGLYFLLYGTPTFREWMTVEAPMYSNTLLWKGRFWFPVLKLVPGVPFGHATLRSIDPEKGESSDSKFKIPFPTSGFTVIHDQLWAVSPGSVTRFDGDTSTEFKTTRFLNRPSEPFFYEDQLAIVDVAAKGPPALLVFQGKDWVEVGKLLIPSNFTSGTRNGKTVLTALPTASSTGTFLPDLQVVAQDGRFHLFLSDGTVVAYREGLELAPVSALAPTNVSNVPDLSNLADWQAVCRVSAGMGIRGKHTWKGGLLNGQPMVVTISSVAPNPFLATSLLVYGLKNGDWLQIAESSAPASLDLICVSDGEQTYIAGESIMQTLRFLRLTESAFTETGVLLKAPEPAFQTPLVRWTQIYQWVFWTGLLFLAWGISRLMTIYCRAEYQFGLTSVELASFTRRTIARSIDYVAFALPGFLIAVSYGLSSQAEVEKNIDKLFDMNSNGLMMRLVQFMMTYLVYAFVMLILTSWIEGRWGITLGKWICGIRTVGSTLRPCGIARAMVRELLLIPETLFNNSIIPVALLIAFTQRRQRLGDIVADTIVIRRPTKLVRPEFEDSLK